MKKIKFFVLFIFFPIMFSAFTCNDDPNYNQDIEIDNLIIIEKKNNYTLNDVLNFNSKFSRFLPEKNQNKLVDLLKTTGSENFKFNFYLNKINPVDKNFKISPENYIVDKGKFEDEYYGSAICVLNNETNEYEFRGGIKLLQKGTYDLRITAEINPVKVTTGISINLITNVFEVDNDTNFNSSYIFVVN